MLTQQVAETKTLSAPELLVLLNPVVEPREVLKAGLKELLVQGFLRLSKNSRKLPLGISFPFTSVQLAARPLPPNPVLRRLLEDLRTAQRHGEQMNQVLSRLQVEYGTTYGGFKQRVVLPRLQAEGLVNPTQRQILGLFKSVHYQHTPQGQELKARLEQDMARARQIAFLLKDDPTQVVALMASLGAAALLVPELWPHWGEINSLLQRYTDGGYPPTTGGDSSLFDEDWKSLEGAFSEFDSSFDASDGGGGDSGGGGE